MFPLLIPTVPITSKRIFVSLTPWHITPAVVTRRTHADTDTDIYACYSPLTITFLLLDCKYVVAWKKTRASDNVCSKKWSVSSFGVRDTRRVSRLTCAQASSTLSRFSVPAWLRCGHRGLPGPRFSDAGKHGIESEYTVLNRRSPEIGSGGFNFFKQPGLTGTHPVTKQAGLFRGITVVLPAWTVSSPGETVANRHEQS